MEMCIDKFTSGWFRAKRRPGKEVLRIEAEKKFKAKELYTAIISANSELYCFLQHTRDFVYVGFLDSEGREYLKYQFNDSKEQTKLFLKEVQYWEYDGVTDKKTKTEIYQFTESGDVKIHKVNVTTRESIQLSSKEPIDLSCLYEDFPDFGEYDQLISKDRMDRLNLSIENI
jgi:hypothetical protein